MKSKHNIFMGQHFLRSKAVLLRIVEEAKIEPQDTVLEIGPGEGVLTEELAKHAKKVVAVEKDARLVEFLHKKFAGQKNIEILHGDILKTDLAKILPPQYIVVANLPYYITSRFLRVFLAQKEKVPYFRDSKKSVSSPARMVLMVQREVAERICASPPQMSLLALSVQAYGKPKMLFRVPREAFAPRPAVESAVIQIGAISDKFFKKNKIAQEKFFSLAKKAFGQKRKILKNSAGITAATYKSKRPQELSLDDWAKIARLS